MPLNRRQFMKRAAAVSIAGGGGAFAYAWRIEPHWVQIVRRDLPIARLPDDLAGRTLVQISDLHIGRVVDERYIASAIEKVSALNADIIAITGDFMTYDDDRQIDAVQRVLEHLSPARLATIGIMGNHDYSQGFGRLDVADHLCSRLGELGISVLRNSMIDVHGLQIAGIDDFWSPRFAPQLVMPHIRKDRAAIVLCHNPDAADLPVWSGYRGWILCGHTHGGQCKPPFFDPPIIPVKNRRYTSGEIDLFDGRKLYINRGLGYLHRVRFNARPEITVFTLKSEEGKRRGGEEERRRGGDF